MRSNGSRFPALARAAMASVAALASCAPASPSDGASFSTLASGRGVEAPPSSSPEAELGAPAEGALSAERAVVARLGLPARFLIGMGNDLPPPSANDDLSKSGIYTLPTKLDLHYVYLNGLAGQGGWPDWNPGGGYIDRQVKVAAEHGIVPMFTLYQAAAWGEYDMQALRDPSFMTPYWKGAVLMFERLAAFGQPAVVHLEPDLWGGAQQRAKNDDPSTIPVKVGSLLPACSGLPEDLEGMGRCLVRLARTIAPKVVIGFQASKFGAPTPERVAAFLRRVGADDADITVVEMLDRDAGCFEAKTDPNCQRSGEAYYWDETNTRHPNFHDHLAWAKAIRDGVGKPLLWWQLPFGVPHAEPGGASGKYRDNRVKYLFDHPEEFVAAGGIGACFGTGAERQTTIATDGGQFARAVVAYASRPVALP